MSFLSARVWKLRFSPSLAFWYVTALKCDNNTFSNSQIFYFTIVNSNIQPRGNFALDVRVKFHLCLQTSVKPMFNFSHPLPSNSFERVTSAEWLSFSSENVTFFLRITRTVISGGQKISLTSDFHVSRPKSSDCLGKEIIIVFKLYYEKITCFGIRGQMERKEKKRMRSWKNRELLE